MNEPIARLPSSNQWILLRQLQVGGAMWKHAKRGLFALSTCEWALAPAGQKEPIPQWHVSVSSRFAKRRATEDDMRLVRTAFGMQEAEEDNHEPGIARNLWLPVDPARRVSCECKVDEVTFTEPDGHRWQARAEDEARVRRAMEALHGGAGLTLQTPVPTDA